MSRAAAMMRGAVEAWRDLGNSPTWERDAATITSPWRVGTWFLVLNLLIIGGLVTVYLLTTTMGNHTTASNVVAKMGLGRLFIGALFLALTFFLTVFVPIRIFGVFLGPRAGRYFDQIVLSGITPWRLMAGKVFGQQVFFALVLTASLPYFLVCLSFGGVSIWEILLCIALVFVYVHVLAIATMVASMLASEIVALPLVVGAFGGSALMGLLPLSPHPLAFTPSASIMGLFYQDLIEAGVRSVNISELYKGPIGTLSLFQSHLLVYGVLSGLFLILGGIAVLLGPINSLTHGLNTFGEAILPGDKKRAGWLKRRFNLRRQTELSFLYENGARAWRAADFRRRWALRETVFVLLIGVALIWLYWWFPSQGAFFYGIHGLFAIAALWLNAIIFTDSWVADRLTQDRWEAGQLNLFCFLINTLLVWLGFGWWPAHLEFDLEPHFSFRGPFNFEIQTGNFVMITLLCGLGCLHYAVLRWLTLGTRSKPSGAFAALLLMVLLAFIPIWLGLIANLGGDVDDAIRLPWLSMANPIVYIDALTDGNDLYYEDAMIGVWWAGFYTLVATILFAYFARRRRRTLSRRHL